MSEEEEGYENIVSSSLSRFIKSVKPHIMYLVPLILLIVLMVLKVIKLNITYTSAWDFLLFWGLIMMIVMGCSTTVAVLQLIVWSKRVIIPGLYFNTTRGIEKGDVKDIGKLDDDPDSPSFTIYAGIGGLSQIDIPGKRDFYIGPTGCFEDWGKVEYFPGDASRYEPERLPDKIRGYFMREFEFNGSKIKDFTVMPGYDRRHSKIFFSPIGYDPKLKKWVGANVPHNIIKLDQKTKTELMNALDSISKAKVKIEQPVQQPEYQSRYFPPERI